VIEGAGGLWVPMPGGSWLPAWISALRAEVVVVGRLGLGTINHCLLTIRSGCGSWACRRGGSSWRRRGRTPMPRTRTMSG
jgi:hypothetical protein